MIIVSHIFVLFTVTNIVFTKLLFARHHINDDLKLLERESPIRIRVSKVKHLVNIRLLDMI